ncbi:MAG TPA: hypothetical protein VFS62_14910 [Chloroflexota bacterium]|nr:hypothetical protein [Chloroflexota bacterium]
MAASIGMGTLLVQPFAAQAAMAPNAATIFESGGVAGTTAPLAAGNVGDSLQTYWNSQSDGCCIYIGLASGPATVDIGGQPLIPGGPTVGGCCGWAPLLGPFPAGGTYLFSLQWTCNQTPGNPPCSDAPPPGPVSYFTVTITAPLPTLANQCKNGGWQTFGVFKNQGDCVSFVATGGKNQPG